MVDAGEVAAAGGFQPDVVVFAGEIGFVVHFGIAVVGPVAGPAAIGRSLAVLRVEVDRVAGNGLPQAR
jgi:hypothetical protein